MFATELMAAYPAAKVIVNRRTDLDAWYASMCRGPIALNKDPGSVAAGLRLVQCGVLVAGDVGEVDGEGVFYGGF
ncbi:hypothetical protein K402DRAFT_388745 [Aulographum hederae CBS 113979]|uniref:Uncharacterized protein n=1 Tax=Aulographum hederae CBS 113979 TaxID=1176131 RepID=A0A6G1HE25_9PEZI|nr:hypothetical protein K402DRAFT_388745 [Aulographum hederae CBS 113979]